MADQSSRYISNLTRDTYALILAGGKGSRLHELTNWRAKPALYFGGKFRIIDFPLSNCVNSGIRRIGVVTQYKSHSLIRHLVRGWGHFKKELGESVEILPASQRFSDSWYEGTADAVFQNIDIIRDELPKYVMILSGDHIYRMDYGDMLAKHKESGAKMTVSCMSVPLEEAAGAFGVMSVDENYRINGFEEKPSNPTPLPNDPTRCLASMGNYVFDTEFLFEQLRVDSENMGSQRDFGKDIIPSIIADRWGKHNKKAYALLPAIALIIGVPALYASLQVQDLWLSVGLMALLLFTSGSYLGPSFAMAQTLAPVNVRAMSTALFFFVLNIIALGGGPTLTGIISQSLVPSLGETEALRQALIYLVVPYAISIAVFLWTSTKIVKDWEMAEANGL
jgi:NDP-sugar pyrophosphorylase family protein